MSAAVSTMNTTAEKLSEEIGKKVKWVTKVREEVYKAEKEFAKTKELNLGLWIATTWRMIASEQESIEGLYFEKVRIQQSENMKKQFYANMGKKIETV